MEDEGQWSLEDFRETCYRDLHVYSLSTAVFKRSPGWSATDYSHVVGRIYDEQTRHGLDWYWVELVMLHYVLLSLSGGWDEQMTNFHLQQLRELLSDEQRPPDAKSLIQAQSGLEQGLRAFALSVPWDEVVSIDGSSNHGVAALKQSHDGEYTFIQMRHECCEAIMQKTAQRVVREIHGEQVDLTHEHVVAHVYVLMKNKYVDWSWLEQLMLEFCMLAYTGGWYSQLQQAFEARINALLQSTDRTPDAVESLKAQDDGSLFSWMKDLGFTVDKSSLEQQTR